MAARSGFQSFEALEKYIDKKDVKGITVFFTHDRTFISLHLNVVPQKIEKPLKQLILRELSQYRASIQKFEIWNYKQQDDFLNQVADALSRCDNLTHLVVNRCLHTFDGPISPFVLLLEKLPLMFVSFRNDASWLDEKNVNKIVEILETNKNTTLKEIDINDDLYLEYLSKTRDDFTTPSDLDEFQRERIDMLNEKIPRINAAINNNKRRYYQEMRKLGRGKKHLSADDEEVQEALIFYRSVKETIGKGGKFKIVE